jgi:hypothetical protein
MAIDTSIFNNVRTFSMEDPYSSAAKILQLRQAQRQMQSQEDVEAAGAASGGDPEKMAQALLAKGHYEPAMKLRAQSVAMKKEQAGLLAEEQKRLLSLVPSMRDALARVNDDPGLAAYRQGLSNLAQTFTTPQLQQQILQGIQQIPARFDPTWKQQQLMTADDVLKRLTPDIKYTDTGGALTPVQTNPNAPGGLGPVPNAQPIQKTAAPAAPTELARYQAERAQIATVNPNDPRLVEYDRVIAGFKAGRSTDITNVMPGPMLPGKAGANKVDEDLLGVTRNLMQLDQIAGMFKPQYQRWGDRAAFAALKVKDSTVGLDAQEKRDLTEFSQYRRNSFNMLNEYIKAITGAALSEPEARRIMAAMPKPGEGIFDGDSPTEFKAKLDDAMKQTKMAVARLSYIKRNGMSLTDQAGNAVIPLERMPSLMKDRARQIEQELRSTSPEAKDDALRKAIQRQISTEFGLGE